MSRILVGIALLALVVPASLAAQDHGDEQAVREAVLDYVEAIYELQPERIDRSVATDLVKRGYWRSDTSEDYREFPMDFDQLRNLAANWNADGHVDASTAVKEVIILDILDKTAAAKLVADWGVDYMRLAKLDGKWMIKNILWQSSPPE